MSQSGYPNVHVRLLLSQRAPATPDRDGEVEIWLKGTKFHVRDRASRLMSEILEDVTAPRGLGRPIRTIEELMDLQSSAEWRKGHPPTELFGDLASDEGWVQEPKQHRWPMPASELAPIAEQILARDKSAGLQPVGPVTRVGRAATEYRGTIDVTENGEQYQNAVTRVIAPPFLLLEDAHAAGAPGLSYRREVLSIDEGSVTDADVTPPP
jgi:hypothetical protein